MGGGGLTDESMRQAGGDGRSLNSESLGRGVVVNSSASSMTSGPTGWTDRDLVDYLRRYPGATASDLALQAGVTTTAIRQRLTRLLNQGLIERATRSEGRGRPTHEYRLTSAGVRSAGNNYQTLALALWDEVRSIEDVSVRRGLLGRLAGRLAVCASGEMLESGDPESGRARDSDAAAWQAGGESSSLLERMTALVSYMRRRGMAFAVEETNAFPILRALACPYPDLAERDRGVCAMEKMAFAELLGADVKLSQCRLDGEACCTFEVTAGKDVLPVLG